MFYKMVAGSNKSVCFNAHVSSSFEECSSSLTTSMSRVSTSVVTWKLICAELLQRKLQDGRFVQSWKLSRSYLQQVTRPKYHWKILEIWLQDFLFDAIFPFIGEVFQYFLYCAYKLCLSPFSYQIEHWSSYYYCFYSEWVLYERIAFMSRIVWTLFFFGFGTTLSSWLHEKSELCSSSSTGLFDIPSHLKAL